MIITINLSCPPHRLPTPLEPALARLGSNEVVLIELQGWLDVTEGEKQDGCIGNLMMENVCTVPVLKIGHHHLEGKLVSLPKPLAVLARGEVDQDDFDGSSSTRYDVMTIVKRKILFSKRPVPMVNLKRA
ncbi:Ctf8-domain-containing protein [Gautieria morchelliformis]|nr:Ctf8-domain-containing protein [Gautieria morchelliformis]